MIKHGHEKRMFGKIKIYAECKTNIRYEYSARNSVK